MLLDGRERRALLPSAAVELPPDGTLAAGMYTLTPSVKVSALAGD